MHINLLNFYLLIFNSVGYNNRRGTAEVTISKSDSARSSMGSCLPTNASSAMNVISALIFVFLCY